MHRKQKEKDPPIPINPSPPVVGYPAQKNLWTTQPVL